MPSYYGRRYRYPRRFSRRRRYGLRRRRLFRRSRVYRGFRGSTRYSAFNRRRRLSSRILPRTATLFRSPPLPNVIYTKFRCRDVWHFDLNVATPNPFVNLYANNPYDPVVGASTTACSGYPQLTSTWRNCLCFATKVVVLAWTNTSVASMECHVYILMEDHNFRHAAGCTRDFVVENGHDLRQKLLTCFPCNLRPIRLSYYRTTKSLEKKLELEPVSYCGYHSAGPNVYTYAQVGAVPARSVVTTEFTNAHCNISITYYCKLWDRINLDA